jgi:hypothetical protein
MKEKSFITSTPGRHYNAGYVEYKSENGDEKRLFGGQDDEEIDEYVVIESDVGTDDDDDDDRRYEETDDHYDNDDEDDIVINARCPSYSTFFPSRRSNATAVIISVP